ncbi:hypothetical protein [Ancylomarina longa]|uniref:DUF4468 domain-containing protein n=1 Tax=Ancylomarina longa TaxID=2487017 RepID=A0A434AVC8_9BACT|nr:hypothetical protein [Ancylomarina longa]RUT78323.1 hypothetical protein DLK05_08325 [Ancylomarina longa]
MRQMMLFCLFILGISQLVQAQQTATTSTGKVVILYDNGSWKYVDANLAEENVNSQNNLQSNSLEEFPVSKEVKIKDGVVEKTVFVEGPSAKLQKYFKIKNIVRCNFTLNSKDGKVTLKTDWKVMNGEGYSYFGFINKGNKISLELVGGQSLDLVYTEEFEPKEFPKYGFTTYTASLELSKEQIELLRRSIVLRASMNWSRRTEEYKVIAPSYFIKALAQILE